MRYLFPVYEHGSRSKKKSAKNTRVFRTAQKHKKIHSSCVTSSYRRFAPADIYFHAASAEKKCNLHLGDDSGVDICGGHILQRAIVRQLPPFQEPCSHFWYPVQEPLVDCLTSTQPTVKSWLQVARHSSSLCSHPSFNVWTGAPAGVTLQCHSIYVAAPHLNVCTIYTVY